MTQEDKHLFEINAITTGASFSMYWCTNTKCAQFSSVIPHLIDEYCSKNMLNQEDKLKQIIEKKRDEKGKFVEFLSDKERAESKTVYRLRYFEKNPWMKHHSWAKTRAKRKGLSYNITPYDIAVLWLLNGAYTMKKPSLDRIDSSKGYFWENCRFIEHAENARLGNLGRINNENQREAGRRNLTQYHVARG